MTPAQAAWLLKLRDDGPSGDYPGLGVAYDTWRLGWTMDAFSPDIEADKITPAGLAALEAYERNKE